MKLSRQFTVFGSAIFCVVIFSLYLMLDRGHLDYPKSPRREGSFPQVSTGGAELREGRRGGPYLPAAPRPLSGGGFAPGLGESELEVDPSLPPPAGLCSVGTAATATPEPRPPGRAELTKCRAACLAGSRSGEVAMIVRSHLGVLGWPRAPAGREP